MRPTVPASARAPLPNLVPSNAVNRQDRAQEQAELLTNFRARFMFEQIQGAAGTSVSIRPVKTPSGDLALIVPFRRLFAGATETRPTLIEVPNVWTLDLTATTIDPITFVGGLIDGIPAAINTDHPVWAFMDDAGRFQGFGMTTWPRVTGATFVGGALGSLTTITVGGTNGYRFTVGARVIVRAGVSVGSAYNQGTITARTATTITVQLDNLYPGLTVGANTALAGPQEVVQTSDFRPYNSTNGLLYPADGVAEYNFTLCGMVQTNAVGFVRNWRRVGDTEIPILPNYGNDYYIVHAAITGAGTTTTTIGLGLWVPIGAAKVRAGYEAFRQGGAGGAGAARLSMTGNVHQLWSPMITNNDTAFGQADQMPVIPRFCTIEYQTVISGPSSLNSEVELYGYFDDEV